MYFFLIIAKPTYTQGYVFSINQCEHAVGLQHSGIWGIRGFETAVKTQP